MKTTAVLVLAVATLGTIGAAPTSAPTPSSTTASTSKPTVASTVATGTSKPSVASTAASSTAKPVAASTAKPTAKPPTKAAADRNTFAPTHAPAVAPAPRPTVTLPPILSGKLGGSGGGCTAASDCYAKADAGMLSQLTQFNESLICDASCSLGVSIDCNMFGLGQNCRSCFNTQAAADYYFAKQHPEQAGTGYIVCPAGSVALTPTTAPIKAAADVAKAPTAAAGAGGCSSSNDCYAKASTADLSYLNKYGKELFCDQTCVTNGGLHCNEFGLGQACRGCFISQADIDYYYNAFPAQIADKPKALICGQTAADRRSTFAPTHAPTHAPVKASTFAPTAAKATSAPTATKTTSAPTTAATTAAKTTSAPTSGATAKGSSAPTAAATAKSSSAPTSAGTASAPTAAKTTAPTSGGSKRALRH